MKTCTIPECGREHHGRGYCQMHLRRLRNHGSTDRPTGRPGTAEGFAELRRSLIDEIEFQLEAGASAKLLPARLGYSDPKSLARRLHRAERHDLAVLFGRAA